MMPRTAITTAIPVKGNMSLFLRKIHAASAPLTSGSRRENSVVFSVASCGQHLRLASPPALLPIRKVVADRQVLLVERRLRRRLDKAPHRAYFGYSRIVGTRPCRGEVYTCGPKGECGVNECNRLMTTIDFRFDLSSAKFLKVWTPNDDHRRYPT